MTAADPLLPETPEAALTRRDDLLLLAACTCAGLAASGHGPPWLAPVWALGFWLTLRSPDTRRAAGALPLLVALAGAWAWRADPLALTGQYLLLALVGFGLYLFLVALDLRQMTGLLWLTLVFLSAPGPLALLGLLGAGLLYGAQAQRGARVVVSRPALAWLAGAMLLLSALGLLLPHATGEWSAPTRPAQRSPAVAAPDRLVTPPAAPNAAGRPQPRSPLQVLPDEGSLRWIGITAQLVMAALAVLAVTVLVLALRERVRLAWGLRPADLLLTAALLVGLGMAFLWALLQGQGPAGGLSNPAGGRSGAAAGASGPTAVPGTSALLGHLGWLVVAANLLFLTVIVAALVGLWRLRRERAAAVAASPDPAPAGAAQSSALDRVRLAYRAALDLLEARGLGRVTSETPQEFARRVGGQLPGGAAPLDQLTRLYEPVRYGHTPPDAHAEQAEAALADLRAALPDPSPTPRPTPMSNLQGAP